MIEDMEPNRLSADAETELGSYFVANYPPFSAWTAQQVPTALGVLDTAPSGSKPVPLGLYLHIPFCRTRCKFCYFRVYTDKNARDVDTYIDALIREVELYAKQRALSGRKLDFVYFGGGTPSFLSSAQLARLANRIGHHWSWSDAREVTFECEPGTLKKGKLDAIKAIGVTRLSLGIEHFDDEILSLNGRAHRSPEVFQAFNWAREVGFDQINVDLIAGMLGDTDSKWHDAVEQAVRLEPDSVTIYQMEVPYNTLIAREKNEGNGKHSLADWPTKRRWADLAFRRFEEAGYAVSSGYTLVKNPNTTRFVYRDALWHGADMIGAGVASFSHVNGCHFQNEDLWQTYVDRLDRGELPIARAVQASDEQRMRRELILQMKLGRLDAAYFRDRFNVEIAERFADTFATLEQADLLTVTGDNITLSREGLLRVDELLPAFFEPQFQETENQ